MNIFQTLLLTLALALLLTPTTAQAGSCTAQQSCTGNNPVSCSGSSSCLVGPDYVQCDGTRTPCPTEVCSASKYCPKPPYSEIWYIECASDNAFDRCHTGYDYVQCGNTSVSCQDCETGAALCFALDGLSNEPKAETESMQLDAP